MILIKGRDLFKMSKFIKLYGPQGVFYRLSLSCFDIKWTEFTFEVCPYKRVSQFKPYSKGKKINLGTDSALILGEISNKKVWILKMGNGEREFCSQPRESEVISFYFIPFSHSLSRFITSYY